MTDTAASAPTSPTSPTPAASPPGGLHAVITGPVTGTVTLPDGSVLDVTPDIVLVDSPERAAQVAHAIGQHWADPEHVHPSHIETQDDGTARVLPFVYEPPADSATEPKDE